MTMTHEMYNTAITLGAMGVFVSALVAFYFALTSSARRKR
jgi:hypothetical protein